MPTLRNELVARLEAIHTCAVAANRELTDDETNEWNRIRQELGMPSVTPSRLPIGNLRPAQAPAVITKARPYSLTRAIGFALGDSSAGDIGLEREMHVHLSKSRSDVKGVCVPIAAILKSSGGQDTISAGPPSVGSVLAATDRLLDSLLADAEAAIRMATILGPLGVTVVSVPDAQKVRVPRKIRGGTATWIARDTGTTSGDLEFDDLIAEPHTLAVAARLNRSSLIYSLPSMDGIVRADLSAAVADGLNDGYLNSPGTTVTPLGLIAALKAASPTRDFASELDGTPTRIDWLNFAIDHVQSYSEQGENRKWLLHPGTLALLTTTPAWTGAQLPVSDGQTVANLPFVVSGRAASAPVAPATTPVPYALCGDFASTFMFLFGPSIDLLANPYHDDVWASGGVLIRGLLDADFLARDLKRIAMASDVAG